MSDLFGNLGSGLGGLMKGLSSIMPQDDPAVRLMGAQSEVSDLKKQENELYAEIGREAVAAQGADAFGPLSDRLKLVQANLFAAEGRLKTVQQEKEEKEQAAKAEQSARTCPQCGHENPDGTKFCQECGAKLGTAAKTFCTSCGAELAHGTRFCGECGARQED